MAEPINLEILRGEQIAIVGDNAAGKTRLVGVLTGHYPLLLNEVHYDFSPCKSRLASEGILPPQWGWCPDKLDKSYDAVILGMHARIDNPELVRAQ